MKMTPKNKKVKMDQNMDLILFDPEWMSVGDNGFDVVIGNPPYINVELVSSSPKKVYKEHYTTIYKRYDIFGLFLKHRCSDILVTVEKWRLLFLNKSPTTYHTKNFAT